MQQRAFILNRAQTRVFVLVLAFAALAMVALVQVLWLGLGPTRSSDLTIDVGYGYIDTAAGVTIADLTGIDADVVDDTSIGAGFSYDLGGATLAGGVADNGVDTQFDLGVSMSF